MSDELADRLFFSCVGVLFGVVLGAWIVSYSSDDTHGQCEHMVQWCDEHPPQSIDEARECAWWRAECG